MSGKFALIIGNTEYVDPGLAQLTAPGKDAEDFARILKDPDICAFDQVNILLNQLSSTVIEGIDEFFDQKKPDDLLVLYFSGHGVRDELGSLYLAVRNTIRSRLRSTAVRSDYIREAMDQSRSKRQVLILDCCNSGAFSQGTKAATGVSIGTASAFEVGYGRIILTASDSTQFAWEGDKVIGETDNSLFTHFLVQGLEGEADLDSDGSITVDELYDYTYEKVRLATPKQTPSKFSSKQQGEIVLRQIRIQDIKPVSLPDELIDATEDLRTFVREGAVQELEKLLKGKNLGLARSAREALERMEREDDSIRVRQIATRGLETIRQAEQQAQEERLAAEKAEAEQKTKEEIERLSAEQKAREEAERLAHAKAEAEQKAEQQRKAQEEAERLAALRVERERLTREKAEAERKAKEEAERLLRAQAMREAAERKAAQKSERESLELAAHGKAESKTAILPWIKYGAIGGVIAIILCAFAAVNFLPSLFGFRPAGTEPAATETPATQISMTEASITTPTELSVSTLGGTAIITFVQEPTTLSPLYQSQWFSLITTQLWLKSLWSLDPENNPVPEIAAQIPTIDNGGISEDGLTLTVKLRDDVRWSDNEPVTANDFVFTYEMYMAGTNTVSSRYPYEDFVKSVEARDDQTLVVNFKRPCAAWMTSLFNGGPIPEHILRPVFDADGTLDNAQWNNAPTVGVGPFVFKEWQPNSHMTFEANPNWIRPSKLEQILIRIVDDTAQEVAIVSGDTDIGTFLGWSQADAINRSGKAKFVPQAAGYDEGWYLNFDQTTAHPAMLDVKVRRAIVLATDREKIVNDLLGGLTTVPITFWDSTLPYGNPNLAPYPYNPNEAKRLLDEAGWKDSNGNGTRDKEGKELVLRYIANQRQIRKDVQALVKQMWADVGIGTELVNYGADYFNGYADGGPQATGKYDIAEYSNSGAFPDPEVSSYWLCSQVVGANNPDGANWQGYCNPDLDNLLNQQATTINPETRTQLYYQIEQIMHDDVVWIGLWKDPDLWSISNRIQGVRLSGAAPFWNAQEWSITN